MIQYDKKLETLKECQSVTDLLDIKFDVCLDIQLDNVNKCGVKMMNCKKIIEIIYI